MEQYSDEYMEIQREQEINNSFDCLYGKTSRDEEKYWEQKIREQEEQEKQEIYNINDRCIGLKLLIKAENEE